MRAHTDNERMLAYLGEAAARLRPFHGLSFDEGGVALFERYGRELPETSKWSLGTANVVVHPVTGVIVAAHRGRYTFLVRRVDPRMPRRDVVETLDGTVDLRPLEDDWRVFSFEYDEDVAELQRAYERAGRR